MKLNCENVEKILHDCLFRNNEIEDGKPNCEFTKVEGIVSSFGFHSERLMSYENEIKILLGQLPKEFRRDSSSGGWSFLKACHDIDGRQWGEHRNMEQLFSMAIGLNLAVYPLPKDMWGALPGGMPYIIIEKYTELEKQVS